MCFTSSSTSDDRNRSKGRTKQGSKYKNDHPQQLTAPRSKSSTSLISAARSQEIGVRIDPVKKLDSPFTGNTSFKKKRTTTVEVYSVPSVDDHASSRRFSSSSAKIEDEPSAMQLKSKQMKGALVGVGKDIRRAATSVSGTLSEKANQTKSKNKARKERDGLVGTLIIEPKLPQVRNAEQIKKAYGHGNDARQTAMMAQDKVRERGEKLSAMQRRTTELEADASNFSSLAHELVRKMENKKWYEI